jgi:hypothetical protein
LLVVLVLFLQTPNLNAFSTTSATCNSKTNNVSLSCRRQRLSASPVGPILSATKDDDCVDLTQQQKPKDGRVQSLLQQTLVTPALLLTTTTLLLLLLSSPPIAAYADELGKETEAPTMLTGETVMICVKRGPLGACTKTELRTQDNENDVSEKYFQQPTELVKRKDTQARQLPDEEGNALIERLKKQTEDNREKNELLVKQRTMMNDSVSFSRCRCRLFVWQFLSRIRFVGIA